MKILWSSNAIWDHTGYGVQAKYALPRFIKLGHEVAQFAWHGLQGSRLKWGDIWMYPLAFDLWGNDIIGAHAHDFGADLVISLQDIWVLPDDYPERLGGVPWACWFPVDQAPVPPKVLAMAKRAHYPITYSRFGQEEMRRAGLECRYIPHGVDCDVFKPLDRAECRERLEWPESPFVVAMVGTNKGVPSRKGFPEALMAFKLFHDRHDDAMLYLHCLEDDRRGGLRFDWLMRSIPDFPVDAVRFVDQYHYIVGLPDVYMADAYNAADVLLQPSYNEGFGIPLLEAQACGTPVLATDWTSMPELVFAGRTIERLQPFYWALGGWGMIPSVESIVEGLEWAYDTLGSEQGREWLATNARRGAMQYDWDKVVERHWKTFLEEVEADIKRATPQMPGPCAEGHDWANVGIWEGMNMSVPCRRCDAELLTKQDGTKVVIPDGFPMAINGVPLDIEDDEQGTVAKIVCREVERVYRLDDIPFEPGDVVLDLGAHVGIVSVYLAKKYPFLKILAVEPVKENFERLVRNVKANGIRDGTVTFMNAAVTADAREVTLFGQLEGNSGGLSILAMPRAGDGGWKVPSFTLAQIIAQTGAERVKLLKLDVEGAEHEILRSDPSVLDKVDWLAAEIHESEPLRKAGHTNEGLLELVKQHMPEERLRISMGVITHG